MTQQRKGKAPAPNKTENWQHRHLQTPAQVCQILGKSITTLRKWDATGELKRDLLYENKEVFYFTTTIQLFLRKGAERQKKARLGKPVMTLAATG